MGDFCVVVRLEKDTSIRSFWLATDFRDSEAFVRSGNFHIDDSHLYDTSIGGYFWSRIAAAFSSTVGVHTAGAYFIEFYAGPVDPSHGPGNRWYSLPLRCLAL